MTFLVFRLWWSFPGLLLYALMHFQYGGAGTFQRPPRDGAGPAGIADLGWLLLGVAGLLLMLFGVVVRIARAVA